MKKKYEYAFTTGVKFSSAIIFTPGEIPTKGIFNTITRTMGISQTEGILKTYHSTHICPFCAREVSLDPKCFFAELLPGGLIRLVEKPQLAPPICRGICHPSREGLNPNSKTFLSKRWGVSEEEALNMIHKRNSSPFYAINHGGVDSHREYQRRQSLKVDRAAWKTQVAETKVRFIQAHGAQAWKQKNKNKDSSSMDHFIEKYGDLQKQIDAFQSKRQAALAGAQPKATDGEAAIRHFKKFHKGIQSARDYRAYIENMLKRETGVLSFARQLVEAVERGEGRPTNTIIFGAMAFGIHREDILGFFEVDNEILKTVRTIGKTFSYFSTYDGYSFNSDAELSVYLGIKGHCEILGINKKYPNALRFYDFWLSYQGKEYFVEITSSLSTNIDEKLDWKLDNMIEVPIQNIKKFIRAIKCGENIEGFIHEQN